MASSSIRVRMYRVGFGDCFLMSLLGPHPCHVLVDCGVHSRGDVKTLDAILADIATETGGDLAIVIATHAHEDHIAGYGRHIADFETFRIGEVWLPWSEDQTDHTAIAMRRDRDALAAALQAQAAVKPLSVAAADALRNAATARNKVALDGLRAGFGTGATVRFLEAGDHFEGIGGVAGLDVRVLGPSRDESFLKRMDPPKAQRYMRVGAGGGAIATGAVEPFAAEWVRANPASAPTLPPKDMLALQRASEMPSDDLAFALDQVLNNTSIVLLFSYRGKTLLFPGDAQWGSWQSWIGEPAANEVLAAVDFYKVSHHGSENATPRQALEGMQPDRVSAMVSTQDVPWPSIPYGKLMDALRDRTSKRIVRSDSLVVDGAPVGPVLRRAPAGFKKGELWFDYVLDVGPQS